MGFSLNVNISAITVFLQGLLSFFSPCVLPLLPMYFGYLSGGTIARDDKGEIRFSRRKVLLNTIFFVLGISVSFFLLGLGMTVIGRFFGSKQYLISRIGGAVIFLFGLYQVGAFGFLGFLGRERRLSLEVDRMAMSPVTAFLLGFVFSFAWTPCVGPALSSVLIMAASASDSVVGFLLIGVYTLGFVLPFLAVGIFTTTLLGLFRRHRNVVRYTAKVGGVILMVMGILMLTGRMNLISGYLSRITNTGQGAGGTESSSAESDMFTESGEETESEALTEARKAEAGETELEVSVETEGHMENEPQTEAAKETELPAIDFELTDQYGVTHRLSDYKGKIVFLNFWATWCPPCRAEMPDIQKLYESYQQEEDSEVVILGIAAPGYGNELDERGIKDFLEENGYTYPVVMDEGGKMFLSYYITAVPTTYMIDRNGNVFGYLAGSMSLETMQDIITQTKEGRPGDGA